MSGANGPSPRIDCLPEPRSGEGDPEVVGAADGLGGRELMQGVGL